MTEPVRWGILGCAKIAIDRVIPAMPAANLTVLDAVASRSLERAQHTAARFSARKAYGSYEELLEDPAIEAIYIPLPNGLHAEWCIRALCAGKHVLCEKPITVNAAEAREVQTVAESYKRYCIEAYAYRFSPVVTEAVRIAQSGLLGPLRFMHTVSTFLMEHQDPENVRLQASIGGGALYDMGCYAINAQRLLAGREPISVWAAMSWSERFDVDMAGTAILDFGDSLLGTIQWGFNAPWGGPFSVVGEAGRLTGAYGWGPPPDRPAMLLNAGGKTDEIYITEHTNGYTAEVEDLSEAIRGLHPPRYGAEPLDVTMRVIDACYRSHKSGKAEPV